MVFNWSLKAVDHVMSEDKPGHNIFEDCLRSFLGELSSCRLTYENCNESSLYFFNQVWPEWTDVRNSNGIETRSFYFTNVQGLFFPKIFTRSGKTHHVRVNLGTSKSNNWKILPYVWRYWFTRVTCKFTQKTEWNSGSWFDLKVGNEYLLSLFELSWNSAVLFTKFVYRNEKCIFSASKRALIESYWPRITYSKKHCLTCPISFIALIQWLQIYELLNRIPRI